MTNYEKYGKELLSFIRDHGGRPARVDGVFVSCSSCSSCENCEYEGTEGCLVTFIKWLCKDDSKADIDTMSCHSCKYIHKTIDEDPCSKCRRSYEDKFELKPKKTRRDEFLKYYPDANVLWIQPCSIEDKNSISKRCDEYDDCSDCISTYWTQEVEE